MDKYKTIQDIRAAHEATGGYFFSPSTMRFFDSRTLSPVFPGGVFVTSERDRMGPSRYGGEYSPAAWGGERRYTVRVCRGNGDIDTVSEFGQFPTRREALNWARGYSAGVIA